MGVPATATLTERRVRQLVAVAGSRGTGVQLDRLAELLPSDAPADGPSLAEWLAERPAVASVHGSWAFVPGAGNEGAPGAGGPDRAVRYLAAAEKLAAEPLAPVRPLLRALLVTGSTAYGDPLEHDDCDLFAIVRDGTLWLTILYVFLRLRFDRSAYPPGGPSVWCFNYVLEERRAREQFANPQGLLFAREALSAHPLVGEPYYRELLREAPWLASEAPRLFHRWTGPKPASAGGPNGPAPLPLRVLNAIIYPIVASYLQLIGLLGNWRLKRGRRIGESFRTITERGRLALRSEKFDRLVEMYLGTSVSA